VLEEAHSLVPEWSSATNDAERQAVNGTARAVLQGRKYGYGSLIVTQRTANVTKSILNQCNTIFGMRVFDATGMGFLENYIGSTYAQLLASLRDRQAVVFGRASSCNSPLIVDVNDSEVFRRGFWEQRVGRLPVTQPPEGEAVEPAAALDEAEDDIPF
jgi:DNA helicase HerA-like ATPase